MIKALLGLVALVVFGLIILNGEPELREMMAESNLGVQISDSMCAGCHGDRLLGDEGPGPDTLIGPRLGHTVNWTTEEFVLAIKTGRTPRRQLSGHKPPELYRHMTEAEIAAIRRTIPLDTRPGWNDEYARP